MSQKLNVNATAFVPKEKKDGEKKKQRRGSSDSKNNRRNNGNRRPAKNIRQNQEPYSQESRNDFEFNIQDELLNGNFKARGKKTQISINHLLDFQLPEREKEVGSGVTTNISKRRNRKDGNDHVHLHGDTFVNANYKFIVDDRFDYIEQSMDPNIPLPQEKIVRVIIPKGQACSICLSEDLVAPRMVSCGHVFCSTCLLHFFSIEEKPSKKDATTYTKKKKYKECPLCSSLIRKETVKPVSFVEVDEKLELPTVGHDIVLTLMWKSRGSMLPLPVNLSIDPSNLGGFPPVTLTELSPYARIMKCDSEYIIDLYNKDIQDIQTQYEIDRAIYNDDSKYVTMAIAEIRAAIVECKTDGTEGLHDDISHLSLNVGLDQYDDSNAFFFYQTAFNSTTRFFLSPLDVKLLLNTFGSYSNFPSSLVVKAENVHYGSMVTESLIQRYKYFGHLPIGTELAFIDVDWRHVDAIPQEVYKKFATELNTRRRKSTWKKQREDKEKKLYERRLEKQQVEFYQRENGEYIEVITPSLASTNTTPLHSLSEGKHSISETPATKAPSSSTSSHLEKTVWGTEIRVTDQTPTEEDHEFEEMLLQMQRQQQEESQQSLQSKQNGKKSNKKKKKMVTLLSSGQSRGY